MNITLPERQRQEFECYCADNNVDPLSLHGLSIWEGWQAAYVANTTISLTTTPAPADQGKTLLGVVHQFMDCDGRWKDCNEQDSAYYRESEYTTRKLFIYADDDRPSLQKCEQST